MKGQERGSGPEALLSHRGVLELFLEVLIEHKFVQRHLGWVKPVQTATAALRGITLTALWRDHFFVLVIKLIPVIESMFHPSESVSRRLFLD